MPFDIKTFIATQKASLQVQFGNDYNTVKPIADKFFAEKELALTELSTDFAAGEFDATFFANRIKDEGTILLSELAALSDIGKVIAENTLNNFASIFVKTILNLIPQPNP